MHLGICLCPSPQGRPAMPGDETEGEHTKGGSPPTGRCVPPRAHCTYCTHTAAHLLDRHTTKRYCTIKRKREGRNCSYDS